MMRGVCVGLLAVLLSGHGALAKPKYPTRYTYYSVTGLSALDVFKSLSRRGPSVKGVSAYATTTALTAQSGTLVKQGKNCRVEDFAFHADFVINLPKLNESSALQGQVGKNWRVFSSFLRRHEEEHRSIWLACGQDLRRRISAIQKGDCKSVERDADRVRTSVLKNCQKRHEQLDARDQKALLRQPFIRQALKGYRRVASVN